MADKKDLDNKLQQDNKVSRDFKLNAADATLQASPELTYMQAIRDAYMASQGAVGSKPLLFLDKAASGVRDVFLRQVRGVMSPEVDLGVTGAIRDTVSSVLWAASGDWLRPGDQQVSAGVEKRSDDFWARRGRPEKFGDYDFQMAAGWAIPAGTKVNGVKIKEPQAISNMLAVFVRDKKGDIEVLNPSTQVSSFSDLTKVPKALWGKATNEVDRRWQETAGTYVEVQLAPIVASGGLGLVGKGADFLAAKAPRLASIAGRVHSVEGALNHGAVKTYAAVTGVSGAGQLSDTFVFRPHIQANALNKIVETVSRADRLNADGLRDSLNGALHDYTFNQGSKAKQGYIPSLGNKDNPFAVLESLIVEGSVKGYQKKNNPWEEWGNPTTVKVDDVRRALSESASFQKTYLTASEKALSGAKLADSEVFVLRVGLDLRSNKHVISGKNTNEHGLNYTEEEKRDTVSRLKEDLNAELLAKVEGNQKLASKYSINLSEVSDNPIDFADSYKCSDKQLSAFVKDELAGLVLPKKTVNPIVQNRIDSPFGFN